MPMNGSCVRSALAALVAVAVIASAAGVAGQSTHDVTIVLDRVGERIEQYYKKVQNIVCTEIVTAQEVGRDLTPVGFARVVESELRVESEADDDGSLHAEPKLVRSLRKVNGRVPKPKDKEACYDPNPLSSEPLAFLLAANRRDYAFTWGGFGKGKEQHMMLIDYRALESGKPEIKEHERDRENCLSFTLPGGTKGRVWIDMATHDVVRFEERLISGVDFRVPFALQRRANFPDTIVLDRFDRFVRYKTVAFDNPAETMLLPESVEEWTIMRGGGSHRTRQVFSDYKRFLTAGRIVKD
jgi:hypothetical protein